ncbi:MAG TPA: hypothetical protein VGK48_28715 [Terriglobia bacterium]
MKLDPEGRAGELSFLTLMELGFETSGACADQGGTGFNAVIREGEAYLQRKPASGYWTALQSAPGSPRVSEGWPDAWRLLDGMPPARTYFYCVYD